jgi:hypothetical protein
MQNEPIDNKRKGYILMRSTLDYGMGVLYLAVGFFLIFPELLGFEMENFDKIFRYMFGGICIVYGVWRFYRGFRKDY